MDEQLDIYTPCACCGWPVDPDDSMVSYGVKQVPTPTMGDPHGVADGLGGYFHPGCSITTAGYLERRKPA